MYNGAVIKSKNQMYYRLPKPNLYYLKTYKFDLFHKIKTLAEQQKKLRKSWY